MKSARITRLLPLSLALMLAMFLTACGPSNTVRLLSPAPAVNPVLPAPNAPRVTVVPFTDNRQDTTNLGVRRDGSAFVASDDVAQWVSRGLADELRRQGVQVSYALDENQARSGIPSSGAAEEIMISSLRDLVQPMARKIKAIVDGK